MLFRSDDIDFLNTRIAGKNTGQPNIAKKRFRNVSIITELNSQKDQLNKLGSMRFATETCVSGPLRCMAFTSLN